MTNGSSARSGSRPRPVRQVSVCVPSYNRPDTLERLIKSFLWQTNTESELVITDDSTDDSVQQQIQRYRHPRIRYFKHDRPKGFCQNLKAAMLRATGDILVILGDDDFFVDQGALYKYRALFSAIPDLVFAYPNRLQVTRAGLPDVTHRFFEADVVMDPGEPAWSGMWYLTGAIGGLCVRASQRQIAEVLPERSILYPQTLLVGHLMRTGRSAGISDYLVGVSAHPELLGYQVNRGLHVYGDERHGSVECLDMVSQVVPDPLAADRVSTALGRQFARAFALMLPDEKAYCGLGIALKNTWRFMVKSPSARRSPLLLASLTATILLPSRLLQGLKRQAKARSRARNASVWSAYEAALREIDEVRIWR